MLASKGRVDKVGAALRRCELFGEDIVFHVFNRSGLAKNEEIAKQTNGFVGADLQNLVQGA